MTYKQNRFRRQKDVPEFFGVTRSFFNKFIRPKLTEIWLGNTSQAGIVYDIIELHALADRIIISNGRPEKKGGNNLWDEPKESQDCTSSRGKVLNSGKYKAQSLKSASEKVQEQIAKIRQR